MRSEPATRISARGIEREAVATDLRVAVVTGAAGGIGAAIVGELLRRRLRVVATDVSAAGLARLTEVHGREPLDVLEMDVRDRAQVERAAEHVIARRGRVDALVNAAGVFVRTPALAIDEEALRLVLAVNLEGALRVTSIFGARMVTSGRIVHVGSVSGATGAAVASVYAASKAGLVAAARSAARELAARRITVNVVAPGFCDTAMLAPERAMVERFTLPRIPAQRLCLPHEVAEGVAFFVCAESDYATGAVLMLDGGLSVG
jgi:NAD(P)-dependent dehydrogenase (short-subunit alcohol dehydrogenase family)